MDSKLDDYLRFNEAALQIRSYRQQLLASNIANADTPHYKARDIDFASTLKQKLGEAVPSSASADKLAMTTSSSSHMPPLALALTSSLHMQGRSDLSQQSAKKPPEPLYRAVIQGSVDGNTVDMDVERNNFTDNAIRYEAGITSVNGQIKAMFSAIQPG